MQGFLDAEFAMMDPSSISNKNSPLPNSFNMAALTYLYTKLSKYTKIICVQNYIEISNNLLKPFNYCCYIKCLSKKDVTINLPA